MRIQSVSNGQNVHQPGNAQAYFKGCDFLAREKVLDARKK